MRRFIFRIAGFTSIWLIFDVSDNISNFIDNHIAVSGRSLLRHADPQVFIILRGCASAVPFLRQANVAANESVSSAHGGRSLPRFCYRFIGIGLLALRAPLNYSLAPMELARKWRFSQKRSASCAHIQGVFVIEPTCAPGLSEFRWRQPIQQCAGAARDAGQYRHVGYSAARVLSA